MPTRSRQDRTGVERAEVDDLVKVYKRNVGRGTAEQVFVGDENPRRCGRSGAKASNRCGDRQLGSERTSEIDVGQIGERVVAKFAE